MQHKHPPQAKKSVALQRAGFTAVEMLLTMGLMTIAAGLVIPTVRQYEMLTDIDTATQNLVQAIRSAELLSQSGKLDTAWGVYIPNGVLFAGESYALRSRNHDTTFPIPQSIQIDGPTEVTFSRMTGLPRSPETFCIESVTSNGHRILSMDRSGLVLSGAISDGPCSGTQVAQDSAALSSSSASSSANAAGTSDSGTSGSDSAGSDATVPCYIRFAVDPETGKVTTTGTNDATVQILEANGTYGPGGPVIGVLGSISMDDGASWSSIGEGRTLTGGEQMHLTNLTQGTKMVLQIQGRYSWLFNKTARSDDADGHIIMLRNGDPLPAFATLGNRRTLPPALLPLVNSAGKVRIDPKSLLFLTELSALDPETSDFRDAIVLVTFQEKIGTCTDGAKPTLKITFNRLENMGTGNAARMAYAGPDTLPFTENQAIPLVDGNGKTIVDGGMVKDVSGLALERGDGWVHILSYGSHENSSGKEIVDTNIQLKDASITDIQNDTDPNVTEFPKDGQSDDTSGGDEFVPALDKKSVVFKTRVITDNDGIYIRWMPSVLVAAATTTDVVTPVVTTTIADPCAVPFAVDAGGILTLGNAADLTVRMVAVDALLGGEGGPRINVRGQVSMDGGTGVRPLWNNRVLSGNETTALPHLLSGSIIALGFTGRYSWTFNRTVAAGQEGTALRVVQPGEAVEELRIASLRGALKTPLRGLVDAQGRMLLGSRDIAYLIDMGDGPTRTYQDVIAVITVEKSPHGNACITQSIAATASGSSTSSSPGSTQPAVTDTDADGVADAVDLCPGTVIPEQVPTGALLFNRFALMTPSTDSSSPAIFREGPDHAPGKFTVADTRGCSCTQILNSIRSPSASKLSGEPILYRQIKNLFSFYVDTSRKFGCTEALLNIVAGR